MTKKKFLLFFVALLILVGIIWIDSARKNRDAEFFSDQQLFPDFFDVLSAQKIQVFRDGLGVTLEHTENKCIINQNERMVADNAVVQEILQSVVEIRQTDLVSQNAASFEQFSVDENTGILVRLFRGNGETITAFYVGNTGPIAETSYIRFEGGNEVYLVKPSVRSAVYKMSINDFRDKNVVVFDPNATTRVQFGTLVLNNVEGVWKVEGVSDDKQDLDAVREAVVRLSLFVAADFGDDPNRSYGLDAPLKIVTLSFAEKEDIVLTFGREGQEIYASRNDTDTVFFVSQAGYDDVIDLQMSDFLLK